jgi:hypothetical protein
MDSCSANWHAPASGLVAAGAMRVVAWLVVLGSTCTVHGTVVGLKWPWSGSRSRESPCSTVRLAAAPLAPLAGSVRSTAVKEVCCCVPAAYLLGSTGCIAERPCCQAGSCGGAWWQLRGGGRSHSLPVDAGNAALTACKVCSELVNDIWLG